MVRIFLEDESSREPEPLLTSQLVDELPNQQVDSSAECHRQPVRRLFCRRPIAIGEMSGPRGKYYTGENIK